MAINNGLWLLIVGKLIKTLNFRTHRENAREISLIFQNSMGKKSY